VTNDPDFRELVGDEGAPGELDRLRRVHELIVAAGPPPELSPAVEHAPKVREESKVLEFKRRRPAAVFAIAAAIAAVAFAVGYGVGHRSNSFAAGKPIDMHGVGVQKAATASISVGKHDSGGNYPLQMSVTGLKDLPKGGWYELLLSKKGHPTASCGDFIVDGGQTTIRLSVPYDLPDWHQKKLYDGWVVVRHLPGRKNAAPIVMTTA
jgi:hypothetical protein